MEVSYSYFKFTCWVSLSKPHTDNFNSARVYYMHMYMPYMSYCIFLFAGTKMAAIRKHFKFSLRKATNYQLIERNEDNRSTLPIVNVVQKKLTEYFSV